MNPYELEKEVRKKSEEWRRENKDEHPDMDPYIPEMLRLGSERREWDKINRKERGTNNPWIQEVRVKVGDEDGLSFVLCPRVKLEYDYVILFYYHGACMDADEFADCLQIRFMQHTPPLYIDLADVVSRRLYRTGCIHNYDFDGRRKGTLVAKANIFIRDLSFIGDHCKNSDLCTTINLAYQSLIQKLGSFFFKYNNDLFHLKARPIASQDPHFLLSQFSDANTEYMERATPVIILNNLVSKWFVQPNSSEPSKELLFGFLSAFGEIRHLSVSKNKLKRELFSASVQYQQYDDFLKALRTLCCCSLRQGDSGELVDYEVALGRDDVFPPEVERLNLH